MGRPASEIHPVSALPEAAPVDEHAGEAPGIHSSNFRFPKDFLWGAATSSQQVEGGLMANDWFDWESAGKVREASGSAADHYARFREDFDLARRIGHTAHRFSIEWSRIEPEPGQFDETEIAHYREVLEELHARGITPVVTLFHYTLPRWAAQAGGWENPEVEVWFERFVKRMALEYKDLVRWWITLNEPVVQVFKGWILGQWPPGKANDFPTAFMVFRRMLRAHVLAYHAIHAVRGDAMVSVAKHSIIFTPCNPKNWRDRWSSRLRHYLFNNVFLDALHKGALRVPGLFWERLPGGRTLDFVGVNYYTRDFVQNTGNDLAGWVGNVCTLAHHSHIGKRNSIGWEMYPEGLAYFLREDRKYGLPILITENGTASDDDDDRWTFILLHLWQVARAIDDGAPVIGYLYWSLLDNYEWADGFRPRFGLLGVDYDTQSRSVRTSAERLQGVIRRGEL
jgi:beta-glucosidase